jgi:sulfur-oxidizing protein SoxY
MEITRRNALAMGTGAFAFAGLSPFPAFASLADDAIAALVGNAEFGEGLINLIAPEIAENGSSVLIEVSAQGASSITLFGDGNPEPIIATMNFGPLSPTRGASTRVRLHQTQNVIAVAKMENGSWQRASAEVKVTIGGCGG